MLDLTNKFYLCAGWLWNNFGIVLCFFDSVTKNFHLRRRRSKRTNTSWVYCVSYPQYKCYSLWSFFTVVNIEWVKVGFAYASCNVFSWGLITETASGLTSKQLNVKKIFSLRVNAGKREFLQLQTSKASNFPQQESWTVSIQCCYFHLKVPFVRLCAGQFPFPWWPCRNADGTQAGFSSA